MSEKVLPAYGDTARLYTVNDVSALLHVDRTTVYKLMGAGALGSVFIGKSRRITARQLQSFVDGLEGVDTGPDAA